MYFFNIIIIIIIIDALTPFGEKQAFWSSSIYYSSIIYLMLPGCHIVATYIIPGPQSWRIDIWCSSFLFTKGKRLLFHSVFLFYSCSLSLLNHCGNLETQMFLKFLYQKNVQIYYVHSSLEYNLHLCINFLSVTNYHKFNELKQCIISISQFS